jgi:hypothetical protein
MAGLTAATLRGMRPRPASKPDFARRRCRWRGRAIGPAVVGPDADAGLGHPQKR